MSIPPVKASIALHCLSFSGCKCMVNEWLLYGIFNREKVKLFVSDYNRLRRSECSSAIFHKYLIITNALRCRVTIVFEIRKI